MCPKFVSTTRMASEADLPQTPGGDAVADGQGKAVAVDGGEAAVGQAEAIVESVVTVEESGPTPDFQLKELEQLIKTEVLEPGTNAYLVSCKWFNELQYAAEHGAPTFDRPIDNKELISETTGRLRQYAAERYDFVIIGQRAWQLCQKWFGGGPEIAAPVVMTKKGAVVAYRRVKLGVFHKGRAVEVDVPAFGPLQDAVEEARAELGIEGEQVDVYDYMNKRIGNKLDVTRGIRDLGLFEGQLVLVDWEDEDGVRFSQKKVVRPQAKAVVRSGKAGTCGLVNLGNTCYFASGTQCLLHTRLLARFFLNEDWGAQLNVKNPLGCKGKMAKAFAGLCEQAWSGEAGPLTPSELKRVIGQFAPQLSGWGQQDSHELMLFMLDGIHEDLNRAERVYVEGVTGDGSDDEAIGEESWRRHRTRNESIVVDTFHGQYRSRLTCPNCSKVSVVFDPFAMVTLPINRPNTEQVLVELIPWAFGPSAKFQAVVKNSGGRAKSVAAEASRVLGREVKRVLLAQLYPPSAYLYWGWSFSGGNRIAFEVPEEFGFLVPSYCRVESCKEMLSAPFLIDVGAPSASLAAVEEAMQAKLRPVLGRGVEEESGEVELGEGGAKLLASLTAGSDAGEEGALKVQVWPSMYPPSSSTPVELKRRLAEPQDVAGEFAIAFVPAGQADLRTIISTRVAAAPSDQGKLARHVSLDECFALMREPCVLDADNTWFCGHCREHVQATKQLDIWRLPPVLVIHLKRFTGGRSSAWGGIGKKLDTQVDFPEELDMATYLPRSVDRRLPYRLYGVSHHSGGLGGGHYTAHAIVQDPSGPPASPPAWYSFNDSWSSPARASDCQSPSAYVLFYERVDT